MIRLIGLLAILSGMAWVGPLGVFLIVWEMRHVPYAPLVGGVTIAAMVVAGHFVFRVWPWTFDRWLARRLRARVRAGFVASMTRAVARGVR